MQSNAPPRRIMEPVSGTVKLMSLIAKFRLPVHRSDSPKSKSPGQLAPSSTRKKSDPLTFPICARFPLNELTNWGVVSWVGSGPSWVQSMMSVGSWAARLGISANVSALAAAATLNNAIAISKFLSNGLSLNLTHVSCPITIAFFSLFRAALGIVQIAIDIPLQISLGLFESIRQKHRFPCRSRLTGEARE